MALSKESVVQAWQVLKAVNPAIRNSFIQEFNPADDQKREDIVFGLDRKSDDGWENVFTNIKHITPQQLALFDERKKEVHNSSFAQPEKEGITCIGWF